MISRFLMLVALTGLTSLPGAGQEGPPVIDVHLHAPLGPGAAGEYRSRLEARVSEMLELNVRYAVLTGVPDILNAWRSDIGDRVEVMPSLLFPCENGLVVMWGRPCFEGGGDWPDLDRLRADIEAGRVQALGEITTQFLGLDPSGPELDPYFALAEEYDLPVFIHMGPGYPNGGYEETGAALMTPNYRAALANPLLLEDALGRYPTVRVVVVHSGWPLADEMVSMLYHHPQVYAEVGLLQVTDFFPREEYYSFLRRLVQAGFAHRILFGSDASLSEGVSAILEADFLSAAQKRQILCGNAARFLRLDESTCN